MATELTIPTLHSNGSGWDNLYEQYRDALEATRELLEKLPRPHGRDYYVQGEDAFAEARRQFDAQREKVSSLQTELTEILQAISAQRRK